MSEVDLSAHIPEVKLITDLRDIKAANLHWNSKVILGDCLKVLKQMPEGIVDLIVTSPPYADSRKKTYGGITPDKYVAWFLPISQELKRVLKPGGTFILNIK